MITDIPSPQDFTDQGLTLLNISWETVVDPMRAMIEVVDGEGFLDNEEKEIHAKAMQRPLAIASALLQQGAEFLVKAAISKISPLLLISANSEQWKRYGSHPTPFYSVRTLDAQDLLSVHNAIARTPFSTAFMQRFIASREIRNTVFHNVDRKRQFSVNDVLLAILEFTTELHGPGTWLDDRRRYLETTPTGAINADCVQCIIAAEFDLLSKILGKSHLKRHFSFDKTQRCYRCLNCHYQCGDFFTFREW